MQTQLASQQLRYQVPHTKPLHVPMPTVLENDQRNIERKAMSREEHYDQLQLALHQDFLAKKQEWFEWHTANPMVWKMFEQFAFQAIKMNRRKISHWLIINRIRWETSIMTTGNEFKISNDFIAFYARHWRETYPMYKDLFNVKRMIGETL